MRKSLLAILIATVMILSFLGPIFANRLEAQAVPAADPTSWYQEVDGVLATDSYTLYPYNLSSTKLGFSKYGELIDNNTNVGLEYAGARDPFAELPGLTLDPNGILPKKVWINGWYLDLTYNHSSWGLRDVWAGALFADLSSYSKPWLRVDTSYGTPAYEYQENFMNPGLEIADNNTVIGTTLQSGGRKTNGTATTDPISLLYDGPRECIAQLTTHLYDVNELTNETLNIVKVMFTIIFDKVMKQVIILKEVKIVDQAKYQIGSLRVKVCGVEMDVPQAILCQFSDREEWDLGTQNVPTKKYTSYIHFYVAANGEAPLGHYGEDWTVLPTLPANTSVVGQYQNTSAYGPQPTGSWAATYDVAQIISNDMQYVGWAAYWPSLSDWSADAGGGRRNLWYRAMSQSDPHDVDSYATPNDEPFLAPLTVGEWDFMLSTNGHQTVGPITTDLEFRGVAVYGVTDLHEATDKNFPYVSTPYGNCLDSEVKYQLDTVFNPWDLHSVMDEKESQRWVTKYYGNGTSIQFYLQYSLLYPDKTIWNHWPYVNESDFIWAPDLLWNQYQYDGDIINAERVLVNGKLMIRNTDYMLYANNSGVEPWGNIYINFTTAPPAGSLIKILFSTGYCGGSWEWLTVGRDSAAIDSAGASMVGEWVNNWFLGPGGVLKMGSLDMQDTTYGPSAPYVLSQQRPNLLPARTGYRNYAIAPNNGSIALLDDWSCHLNTTNGNGNVTWLNGLPISSSNIISIGGPSANMLTEYTNDFTNAFATLPIWTGPGLPTYELFASTCWSKNLYLGNNTIGYGLISTFRDLNGTIHLVIYGYSGQDTYYTCWALLHSDVLHLALEEMPHGVTTLMLQFNYTLHPTDFCFVTIVEALGTISEFDFQRWLTDGPVSTGLVSTTPDVHVIDTIPRDWPTDWITRKFPTIHVDP